MENNNSNDNSKNNRIFRKYNNITILQWNIRGIKKNMPELQILIEKYNPNIICLQETKTTNNNQIEIKNYSLHYNPAQPSNTNPSGGLAIYVKNKMTQSYIPLPNTSNFIATKITHNNKTISICNSYIKPNNILKVNEIQSILKHIPKPLILLGDFNGHSQLWGDKKKNAQGKEIENLILTENICLILPNKYTAYHQQQTHSQQLILP